MSSVHSTGPGPVSDGESKAASENILEAAKWAGRMIERLPNSSAKRLALEKIAQFVLDNARKEGKSASDINAELQAMERSGTLGKTEKIIRAKIKEEVDTADLLSQKEYEINENKNKKAEQETLKGEVRNRGLFYKEAMKSKEPGAEAAYKKELDTFKEIEANIAKLNNEETKLRAEIALLREKLAPPSDQGG